MPRIGLLLPSCALLCFAATSALAQQYTVSKLIFNGPSPYTQAALEAATGLKAGDNITKEDIQTASQRLVDTGAFTEMQTTLDGPIKAISVVFKLKGVDPSRLLTVGFENFVWYTPDDLKTEVQKRVPLFNGTVPEGGNQQEAVASALKQLLIAKNVDATIAFEPVAPSPSQPLRIVEYRVTKPTVRIHTLKLDGVTPPFSAAIDKLSASAAGKRYNEGPLPSSLTSIILSIYKNAGYQASTLSSLTRTITASSGPTTDIDVSATIQPGDVYHLSHLDYAGSDAMSAEGFKAEAALHPGDVASQKALLQSLAKLEAAYRNKGYMDVVVTATPQLDTTQHQVAFAVAATPGSQYTLSKVTPVNLSEAQQKDFESAWKLHPGDVYNEGYINSFLKSNTAVTSLAGLTASFKTVADPDAHTVELIMTFSKMGTATTQ